MKYELNLIRGNFYKIKEGWWEKSYTIVCPSEYRKVGVVPYSRGSTINCIFTIRGNGKKSELCTKKLTGFTPHVRLVNEYNCPIRPLTRKDYIKVGSVLKKYGFIYNKKTNQLINI